MTHHNIFQEIEEDLERQKLEELWKRYGSWVIVAAALVVLATGGITSWHTWRAQQQQKATAALASILDSGGDNARQIAALESYAEKNRNATQGVFAQLHAADLAAQQGDDKKAIALYDAIAADTRTDPAFRQLADLLSVRAQMDTGDPVALQKRLQPLLADNAPWRDSAMETGGFLALRAGDKPKAKQLFTELSQAPGAPPSLILRAADMARFLDE